MTFEKRIGRLHVITDESLQPRFSHVELARLAAEGGADTVQFREKRARPTAELVGLARQMLEILDPHDVELVVNDRVDVALAARARAVHLGPHDLTPELARRLLGPEVVIGGTANGLEQAIREASRPVDYLGVGPVFGTSSKQNPSPELGLDMLRKIVEAVDLPVVAIGNVTPERVAEVLATGAHGIAVLSVVVGAEDPARETHRFREAIEASEAAEAIGKRHG